MPLHSFLLSLFFLLTLVVFLSFSQTSPSVFSSHSFLRSLRSLSLWVFFFWQWFNTWFDSGWVEMVIGGSLMVGCDGKIQWWVGAKLVNGFIKTELGNWIAYQLIVGVNLAFNTIKQTIGWTDWAKAAIVPGLVSLIVEVICNGVRWYGCGVLICGSGFWVVVVQWRSGAVVVAGYWSIKYLFLPPNQNKARNTSLKIFQQW